MALAPLCAAKKKSDSVKLPNAKRTYFYKIDSEIVAGVEDGMPSTISSSMVSLRRAKANYEENEKVLIYVAAEIMKIVWPSQKVSWEVYDVPSENPYVGALNSVNKGVFDSSTGNVDFLATLLPALVLFKSNSNDLLPQCRQALAAALEINPSSRLASFMLAVAMERGGETESAQNHLKNLYEAFPENEEIAFAYVRVLQKTQDYDLAAKVLEKMQRAPNDLELLKQHAYISFAQKDYSAAELYVAKVLQQTPNDLEFVLFRAKILVEKKDYIHAVSLLDVYERQNSTSLDYLILRARVQLDWSKNNNAATETVEKALRLYPDNVDALIFAARIASSTDAPVAGMYADELSEKILAIAPNNEDALFYALEGLINRENWAEAYSISKKLIERSNVTSEIAEKHVLVCIKLGKNNEAYDFAKKMHEASPDDETILMAYIQAYSKVGKRDAVLKYIGSLMTTASPKMKSYLYYSRSFLQLTEENQLADLRSSLISNPRNSDALFRLYELYYGKQDYRKAQYYLRQVVAINPNDNSIKQLNEALTKLIK